MLHFWLWGGLVRGRAKLPSLILPSELVPMMADDSGGLILTLEIQCCVL